MFVYFFDWGWGGIYIRGRKFIRFYVCLVFVMGFIF